MTTETSLSAAERNMALVDRFFQTYAAYDLETMRNEILAPDVRWHIPGRHPLSGTHEGVDEVIAFFDRLGSAGFKADRIYFGADDDRVVDVHRGWSEVGDGHDIDMTWVLVWRIENGRVVEATNFAQDQASADAFFHRTFRLAPVSRRLA
ncbi:nuclear transport factor 2 family protein [Streptomyces sp. NPDC048219]|uniref:nuclear transport factor 2 family protein n=1 Tax=unclassified Streptomyces TaxID=2593676 RepID=UPI003441AFE0